MNKILWWSLFASILLSSCAQQDEKIVKRKPNIIIILADDMGYGDPSNYGGEINTPNIDMLAREGMKFTDFHTSGTVCSPTRAGLITGRYQHRSGVDGVINASPKHPSHNLGVDPQKEITFPNLMKAAGYKTALMGKWHIGYLEKYRPMKFGFDQFVGFLSGNIDYISHYDRMQTFDWWHNDKQVVEAGYSTHLITKHAIDFIKENKDQPFVLYIAHEAVHNPMQGPNDPILRGPNKQLNATYRDGKAVFKDMLTELDTGIGEIIDTIKASGLADDTLVFFTSDNGPMPFSSAGALRGKKGSIYEGGHRVPALAWWPGQIPAGTVNKQMAITLDLMPTLLELSGAKLPENHSLDGISLVPYFSQVSNEERELYWRNGGLGSKSKTLVAADSSKAMRDGKWKLVAQANYRQLELYNLDTDINESVNLSSKYPERVQRMLSKLKEWEQEMSVSLPYQVKASL